MRALVDRPSDPACAAHCRRAVEELVALKALGVSRAAATAIEGLAARLMILDLALPPRVREYLNDSLGRLVEGKRTSLATVQATLDECGRLLVAGASPSQMVSLIGWAAAELQDYRDGDGDPQLIAAPLAQFRGLVLACVDSAGFVRAISLDRVVLLGGFVEDLRTFDIDFGQLQGGSVAADVDFVMMHAELLKAAAIARRLNTAVHAAVNRGELQPADLDDTDRFLSRLGQYGIGALWNRDSSRELQASAEAVLRQAQEFDFG
ncbi:MAG TPA: hypothetical protein VHA82_04705 [Ramlibacter sp.]|uniref:hypothetical protein n=1 Tax=Ramlibacter sp. TaxID=1917967 RepID=UPI002CE551A2|nr:hypothetical protein [Ramlibacter sp.]HVZ43090.1 hypothetical protein [Ramlibacter sp.]